MGKGGYIILLTVVAVLTLTTAVMAVFIFLKSNEKPEERTVLAEKVVPKEEDLAVFELFEKEKIYNLKNDDPKRTPVIQVNIELVYFKQIKGLPETAKTLANKKSEILEIIGNYFLTVTIDDVRKLEAKQKAKEELKHMINEMLLEHQKQKDIELIYDVVISEWFFQQ